MSHMITVELWRSERDRDHGTDKTRVTRWVCSCGRLGPGVELGKGDIAEAKARRPARSRRREPCQPVDQMSAYNRLVCRFGGQRPQIQCWSPTEYRVQVTGWHVHSGAATSAPFGDGKTLEAACGSLLRQVDAPHVDLVTGDCDWQCEARYSGSPKARIAHGLLVRVLEESAATVNRWPAWRRGLPPCPSDGCNMATGHPGECE